MQSTKRLALAILTTVLSVQLLFPSLAHADPGEGVELDIDPSLPVVVSMGDSYSSGEGCPEFYGTFDSSAPLSERRDFFAHRSTNSWPGRLEFGYHQTVKLSDVKDENWFFVASTGAQSEDIYSMQQKETPYVGKWFEKRSEQLPKQDYIFDEIHNAGETVDYVTLTIGGNDVDFGAIVTSLYLSRLDVAGVWAQVHSSWQLYYCGNEKAKSLHKHQPAQETIPKAYRDIREKAGDEATILVFGYPPLFDEGDHLSWTDEGTKVVNDQVRHFNDILRDFVKEMNEEEEGRSTGGFVFLDVWDSFDKHRVGSKDPWLNNLRDAIPVDSKDRNKAYAIHPNQCKSATCGEDGPDCGISAYADIAQAEIYSREKEKYYDKLCTLDISNRDVYWDINRFLTEFGAAASLTDGRYYDAGINNWVDLVTWEEGMPPTNFMASFAIQYCGLYKNSCIEEANDWGVGKGGSAMRVCDQRVSTADLNPVLQHYFGDEAILEGLEGLTDPYVHLVDGYLYWGITAPYGQHGYRQIYATDVEDLGNYVYKVYFDAVGPINSWELPEGVSPYQKDADWLYSSTSAQKWDTGWAIVETFPGDEDPLVIRGWYLNG